MKKLLLFVFIFGLLTGCTLQSDQKKIVRLGYLQNDLHHLPAFIALEKNFFKQEGIEIEVAGIFRAGPEEMSAFAAGELDIGYVGQAPATAAVLNGVADVKFIAQVNLEGSAVVVRRDSLYQNISDLNGKTVAIPGHATMQDFLLRRALHKNKVPIETVRLIVLKPPEMIQALDLKNIESFIAWQPYPALAVHKGGGKVLISSPDIWPDHPCCVLVAASQLCAERPEMIEKIKLVHRRSCEFIKTNRQEAVRVGMQYTGMDRDTVIEALRHISYTPVLDRQKAVAFVDFIKDLRYIKPQKEQISLRDMFYE